MNRLRTKILLFSLIILVFHPVFTYAWECEVTLDGPNVIKEGQTITLSASGTPAGGSYSWSNTPNLVPNGSTAQLTGYKPSSSEHIYVTMTYTSPKGKKCHARKAIWVCLCSVKINGPGEFKVGDPPITLTAEGNPPDGTYEWSATPGLVPNGSIAQFTGQEPGNVTIEVAYNPSDDGEPCYGTHTITVLKECSVSISGTSAVGVGNHITLTASGSPEGGTYVWEKLPGLLPGTSSASFTGQEPGDVAIEVVYTPPDGGEPCPATHNVTVFGVESITGPSCVNSGTTLTRGDFSIVTNPSGFEDLVIVSPLSFSTLSQSAEVTVTAYSGTGAGSDEATTTIRVVNSNIKTIKGLSFEIPNYVKKPLEIIGLGDKVDLSVETNFEDFKKCCVFGVGQSTDGSFNVALSVSAGPFAIFGFPLPGVVKKYVTLDALNVTLSGSGSVEINGKYAACEDKTNWSGGGSLNGGIETASEVKAKIPKVLVIQGKLAGSMGVTEKLDVLVSEMKVTSNWDGLAATGTIILKIKWLKVKSFKVSTPIIEGKELPVFWISLPSLK
ncbi:MAG: hypothetical protein KAT52_05235 [Desulfobacterales bacterium]|nr:hypothetical protein [Desulfobacterales bacterium]